MKNIVLSLCLYIFCFLVIGLYTLIIYLIGQTFWPEKTKGSLIIDKNSNIRGSYLVAQYLQDAHREWCGTLGDTLKWNWSFELKVADNKVDGNRGHPLKSSHSICCSVFPAGTAIVWPPHSRSPASHDHPGVTQIQALTEWHEPAPELRLLE